MTGLLLVVAGLVNAVAWLFVWALCRIASREVDLNGDLKRQEPSVRCSCDCGCFLRCELPEELADGLCAFCLDDQHVCSHGTPFCEECADCDAFTNVIRIDAPRGNS